MLVVFAALGAYGHLFPMLPLALACRDAGHDVVVATGAPFLDGLPVRTVPGLPAEVDLAWAEQEVRRRHPDLHGFEATLAMFGDVTAGATTPTMLEVLAAERADLLVTEPLHLGAAVAGDLLGVPTLVFAIGLAPFMASTLHPVTIGYQRDRWLERGLNPPDTNLLGEAFLDPCPPSLQVPRDDVPRLPIRSVAWRGTAAALPSWLTEPAPRPRVYLTLGTVSFGAVDILRRAASEIAGLEVDLLVAVGPDGDPDVLAGLPGNVHVERFVPQADVLSRVDLIVHHGGTGTVLAALEAGLPQVILPQGADQPFNADLIAGAGAGRRQANDDYTPGSIAALVEPLLGECAERATAAGIAAEITAMPAPAEVVPELVVRARSRA
ncbi:MAG TPA: glycosyltransferase [Microlunatus sp.]|nr:glycosyltransferase [Microlunatus sp.]